MLALLILIPLYLLALMAILDALKVNRYPIGACSEWRLKDSAVTDRMKQELIGKWDLTKLQYAMFSQGNMSPIMGWGYAYQFQNYNPPCSLELKLSGSERYTMTATNQAIVSDAVKALMRDYRKSERAIKRQQKAQAKLAKSYNLVPAMA